jgi:thiol:disulfide interchange protein
MKVVYPKNIKRGLLAGMTFTIGPLSISIVQLFILALWVALALAAFNSFWQAWSKFVGILVAIIIIIITIIIAFFKVSELWLLAYIAKLIRNNFFDAKKKFQVNYDKKNPIDIMIQEFKTKEEKQIIEQKESTFDQQHLTDIEKKWLI